MGAAEIDRQGRSRCLTQKNKRVEQGDDVEEEEAMC
jgi:hypothetical protein